MKTRGSPLLVNLVCVLGLSLATSWFLSGLLEQHALNSSLLKAVKERDGVKVKSLLSKGASASAADWLTSALVVAAGNADTDIALALIRMGADVNACNEDGTTPLFWAASHGNGVLVKALLENGAYANSRDEHGSTPLLAATRHGHRAVVQYLLQRGAKVNVIDAEGNTPLRMAVQTRDPKLMRLLTEAAARERP